MHIGIVTIYNVPNYGAMLQCYALCEYLRKLGHDPFLFDIPLSTMNWIKYLKRNLYNLNIFKFVSKYLPYQTSNLQTNADAYLIGSDQVWNPQLTGTHWREFMLSFAPGNKPKYAFASSFGVNSWTSHSKTLETKALLQRLDKIYLREDTGVSLLKDEFDMEGECVLDPCFLLEDYANKFNLKRRTRNRKKLTTYKLCYNRSWYDEIRQLAKSANMQWSELLSRRIRNLSDLRGFNIKSVGVQQWLQEIYDADIVITDSFHGMVFSILFERQFIVLPGVNGRSSRITDLLQRLNLSERYTFSLSESQHILDTPINYAKVTPLLKKLQKQSRDKLQELFSKQNVQK